MLQWAMSLLRSLYKDPYAETLTELISELRKEEAVREARQKKWDERFLKLAEHVAEWSRDGSTKCGACVVRDNEIVSLGYNGFPKGVADLDERYADRETKYRFIVHAEANSILFARQNLTGCTLYTFPFQPCSRCTGLVIQSGISRVVAPVIPEDKKERWGADMETATLMFKEAGVELVLV